MFDWWQTSLILSLGMIIVAAPSTLADENGCVICGVNEACNQADGVCMNDLCGADCTDSATTNNCDPDCDYSGIAEVCDDGLDNDCDGDVDLADSECDCNSDGDCPSDSYSSWSSWSCVDSNTRERTRTLYQHTCSSNTCVQSTSTDTQQDTCGSGYSCESGSCTLDTYCGDGTIQDPNDNGVSEECDAGSNNGNACSPSYDSTCNWCDTNCNVRTESGGTCGDGTIQDPPEVCDGSNMDGMTCSDFIDTSTGDPYDAGSLSCASNCQSRNYNNCCSHDPGCTSSGSFCNGDTKVTCTMGADGCYDRSESSCGPGGCSGGSCSNAFCGDDTVQNPNDNGVNEICDGADLNGENCQSQGFDNGSLSCNSSCTSYDDSSCCNNEQLGSINCDSGAGTYCDGSTQVTCSDTDSDVCLEASGTSCAHGCSAGTCNAAPTCGDGVNNQPSEECDDGNTVSGDGCSASCQVETCSDGIMNNGETGVDCGGPNCAACATGTCGDGTVQDPNSNGVNEECDDGNSNNQDACDNNCQLNEVEINSASVDETGPFVESETVTLRCDANIVTFGVEATGSDGSSCSFDTWQSTDALFNCNTGSGTGTKTLTCGVKSGYTQIGSDKSTTIDVQSSNCSTYTTQSTCNSAPANCDWCNGPQCQGNKYNPDAGTCKNAGTCSGYECDINQCGAQCDTDTLGGATCTTQGFDAGTLSCNLATCTYDTGACTTWVCGDGSNDPDENCNNCPSDAGCSSTEVCTHQGGGTYTCEPADSCQDKCSGSDTYQCAPSSATLSCGYNWTKNQPSACGATNPGTECYCGTAIDENCTNGVDDDCDGEVDEADSECTIDISVTPEAPTIGQEVTVTTTSPTSPIRGGSANYYVRKNACGGAPPVQKEVPIDSSEPQLELPYRVTNYDGHTAVTSRYVIPEHDGSMTLYACIGRDTNQASTNITVTSGPENTTALCSDGLDNDLDGSADCADPTNCRVGYTNACDTTSSANCTRSTSPYNACDLDTNASCGAESACGDNIDNDCDGYVDEADSDCGMNLALPSTPLCPDSTVNAEVSGTVDTAHGTGDRATNLTNIDTGTSLCSIPDQDNTGTATCTFQTPSTDGRYDIEAAVGETTATSSINVYKYSFDGNATIEGTVTDQDGNPISSAQVTTFYPEDNGFGGVPAYSTYPSDASTITASDGTYSLTVKPGEYYVRASKDGYFAEESLVTPTCGETVTNDITVREGACNQYCANWQNRCNPQCDGQTFAGGTCSFHNESTRERCAGVERGTLVETGTVGNTSTYVRCCEGAPETMSTPPAVIESVIDNVLKKQRVLQNSETKQPVQLVVNVWNE